MRIVVAMSGGVDSSVAAALLADQGHDVIGLSMQLYDQSEGQTSFGSCCTLDDLHDARRVAAAINIPHYILNFEKQFDDQGVSTFVREYANGRTPLPCAHCNSDLKFATLAERARGFGADRVATGHYARVENDATTGRFLLKRGVDSAKDQSYFLFSLTPEQLSRAVFPVGDRPKDAVREYARASGGRKAGQSGDLFHPGRRLRELRVEARAGGVARRHDRRRGRPRPGRPRRHPQVHDRSAKGPRSLRIPDRRTAVRLVAPSRRGPGRRRTEGVAG